MVTPGAQVMSLVLEVNGLSIRMAHSLRKTPTCEGRGGRSLVDRVRTARQQGWLTEDLERAVQYARLIRNAGAHGGTAVRVVSEESARGAMRFTQQTLRLLFEVPGELALLTGQPPVLEGVQEEEEEEEEDDSSSPD